MADKTSADILKDLALAPSQIGDLKLIEERMNDVASKSPNKDGYQEFRAFGSSRDDPKSTPLMQGIGLIAREENLTKYQMVAGISARLQIDQIQKETGRPIGTGELKLQFKSATNNECKDITLNVAKTPEGNLVIADQKRNAGVVGGHDSGAYNSPVAKSVAPGLCK